MKALTIHQPYVNAILYYGKDIENRSWTTNFRGTFAVHAGAVVDDDPRVLKINKMPIVRSAIIGVVDILDCVDTHRSKWFGGPIGFVLGNPRPLSKPIPCKGQLNFWNVPPEIEKEIRRQLKGIK
jgi:hypothetical protein